jgi:8-oxo-dGTP pyrophosphatase MutT (NUDIX family)
VRLLALDGVVSGLARALASRVALTIKDGAARRAAVAVVASDGPEPALLFIRRRERVDDPWSGQMAFPGGFHTTPDESSLDAARRETLEETGLSLADARVLGRLDDLHPRTPFLPPIVITPYVFAVPRRAPVAPGAEADEAFWIPLRDLFADAHRGVYDLRLPDGAHRFPAIRIGPHIIWGLTERILAQLGGLVGLGSSTSP